MTQTDIITDLSEGIEEIRRHLIEGLGCCADPKIELLVTLTDVEEDEPLTMTLIDFLEQNSQLWEDIFRHVKSSAPGQSFLFGGGASPAFKIEIHTAHETQETSP